MTTVPETLIAARGSWTTCARWERTGPGLSSSLDTAEGFPSIDSLGDVFETDPVLREVLATLPVGQPVLLLVTFERGPNADLLVSSPSWMLDSTDGDPPPGVLQEVINLEPGEVYEGGGGAEATWRVRRLP